MSRSGARGTKGYSESSCTNSIEAIYIYWPLHNFFLYRSGGDDSRPSFAMTPMRVEKNSVNSHRAIRHNFIRYCQVFSRVRSMPQLKRRVRIMKQLYVGERGVTTTFPNLTACARRRRFGGTWFCPAI